MIAVHRNFLGWRREDLELCQGSSGRCKERPSLVPISCASRLEQLAGWIYTASQAKAPHPKVLLDCPATQPLSGAFPPNFIDPLRPCRKLPPGSHQAALQPGAPPGRPAPAPAAGGWVPGAHPTAAGQWPARSQAHRAVCTTGPGQHPGAQQVAHGPWPAVRPQLPQPTGAPCLRDRCSLA